MRGYPAMGWAELPAARAAAGIHPSAPRCPAEQGECEGQRRSASGAKQHRGMLNGHISSLGSQVPDLNEI